MKGFPEKKEKRGKKVAKRRALHLPLSLERNKGTVSYMKREKV